MLANLTSRTKEEVDQDVAREQLIALLEEGLSPGSYLLDIGCGTLRCGRWVIPLLDPGHYCGIEPRREELEGALAEFDQTLLNLKKPRFDHNADFDFSCFGVPFTHFVARSIWSHASKGQIEQMLDSVVISGAPDAVLLASFRPTGPGRANDYKGANWKGVSHESDQPGIVAHSVAWLRETCEGRGLLFEVSSRAPVKKNGQVWAVVRKTDGDSKRLRALRASHLARELKHNLRTMKFSTLQLIEQLGLQA